ncbi:unnamed protein product, partial [Ectocarpus fasciculatus]
PNRGDLLHYAAQENNAAAIRALFEAGADIEGRYGPGLTPLHFAAIFGGKCTA